MAQQSGGVGMMPQHDNRSKNNSGNLKSRLSNAQNPHMPSHHHQSQHHHHQQHHHQQQHHLNHHQQQQQHHHGMPGGSNDFGADADSDQVGAHEYARRLECWFESSRKYFRTSLHFYARTCLNRLSMLPFRCTSAVHKLVRMDLSLTLCLACITFTLRTNWRRYDFVAFLFVCMCCC